MVKYYIWDTTICHPNLHLGKVLVKLDNLKLSFYLKRDGEWTRPDPVWQTMKRVKNLIETGFDGAAYLITPKNTRYI